MSEPEQFVIIGAGGQGAEALWVARASGREGFLGFLDADLSLQGAEVMGAMVIGPEADFIKDKPAGIGFHCAIGNNTIRQKVAEICEAAGMVPVSLVHPQAIVAPEASVSGGAYVGAFSVISVRAQVGKHVLINLNVTVGHDAVVGDYVQLCPGARVNGICRVGEMSLIGSNAVIEPGRTVGANATLGANSYAVGDVEDGHTAMGVPARTIFRKK